MEWNVVLSPAGQLSTFQVYGGQTLKSCEGGRGEGEGAVGDEPTTYNIIMKSWPIYGRD